MAFQARLNVLIMRVLGFLGCFLFFPRALLWRVAVLCADDLLLASGAAREVGGLFDGVDFFCRISKKKCAEVLYF